jgi:hypothetical protein
MDNHKEIELPRRQWKEGDILINNSNPLCRAVFKKYNDGKTFEAYFVLYEKAAHFDTLAHTQYFHLASEKEMKNLPPLFSLLMGALNNAGLCLPKKV